MSSYQRQPTYNGRSVQKCKGLDYLSWLGTVLRDGPAAEFQKLSWGFFSNDIMVRLSPLPNPAFLFSDAVSENFPQ